MHEPGVSSYTIGGFGTTGPFWTSEWITQLTEWILGFTISVCKFQVAQLQKPIKRELQHHIRAITMHCSDSSLKNSLKQKKTCLSNFTTKLISYNFVYGISGKPVKKKVFKIVYSLRWPFRFRPPGSVKVHCPIMRSREDALKIHPYRISWLVSLGLFFHSVPPFFPPLLSSKNEVVVTMNIKL